MGTRIDRWVRLTVAACALLAGLAAYTNHVTQPCGDRIGAAGMCVPISLES
ncbi:hypothetical protein [Micromonospora okii]|uniref:hypothetical protein n=1 Tax=Micromonospora okii TaxID=1182970 RepID=UPI001E2BF990|nr:hypothetical protein [Micromonospora okii]